jgi:SAM-dependent methyltransferase
MAYLSMGHYTAVELLKDACPSGVVIDAGAFPGGLTRQLAKRWKVIALDKDPQRGVTSCERFQDGLAAVQEDSFRTAMQEIGVDALSVDLETDTWPLESDSIDAITLTEVIEHLYVDPLNALSEMNRVLKKGGVLLLSTPNLLSLRNRLSFLKGDMAPVIQPPFTAFLQKKRLGHFGHVRLYAPAELAQMLATMGFECETKFYRFGFWDLAPGATAAVIEGAKPSAPAKRRSPVAKLFKSPKGYAQAVVATMLSMLESRVPQLRPHMYVVARKVRAPQDLGQIEIKAE